MALIPTGDREFEDPGDLSPEEVAASKHRARINALVLAAVLLVGSLAPYPWNVYAPVLLVIPFVFAVADRVRRSAAAQMQYPNGSEPYSHIPKDPADPRRYKPIG